MMTFDWTTFILEIANFLVLVWLLQRFFYRPVLNRLDARQQAIQNEIAQAQRLRAEADELRQQYERRLEDWQQQQETSRRELTEELARTRADAVLSLKQTLADEEAKWQVRHQAEAATHEAALLREAGDTAYAQVAMLLQRLASPDLTLSIVEVFLDDLQCLPAEEKDRLQKAAASLIDASLIESVSAHPLPETTRQRLQAALSDRVGKPLSLSFRTDADLIAGLRVVVGECQLDANLSHELAFFRRRPPT